ncbi:MAG TPA: hypothetical protein VMC79_04430 [Rectinemataceae bacterium]|nr:hypothetical protein [Rectinemataceae bacterium]
MKRSSIFLPVAALCFGLSACTSLTDSVYLVQNVSDSQKSKALTEAGIAAYNDRLVKREQFDQVEAIKKYFTVALRYDPTNLTAQNYLVQTDGFVSSRLRDSLKEARGLLAQNPRQEDDSYRLAVDAQRAARIDRNNAEVVKLLKDSEPVRTSLAGLYLSRAKTSMDKIGTTSSETAKEPLYIDAFQNTTKVMDVDPGNLSGKLMQIRLHSDISDLVKRRLGTVDSLAQKGSFSAADAQLGFVSDLNDSLGGEFDDQIAASGYSLNYQWGSYYYGKRSLDRAQLKLNAALAYKRGPEALDLLQKISADRSRAERGATFEDGIKIVDAALRRGDLGSAQRGVEYLAAHTVDSSKTAILDDRRAKIRAAVADDYSRAVDLYKAEKFADAIDLLEAVVAVDAGYQQAADYLDKAKAKQKLLDQY